MNKWQVLHSFKRQEELTVDKLIEVLLNNRGIKKVVDIKEFLNGDLSEITVKSVGINPVQLAKAIKRVETANKKNQTIVIYGDYDVDGICATAILWEMLYGINKKAIPYIPHRVDEGYGLSIAGINSVLEKFPEVKLIITVDNGVVAFEAVEYAKSMGIDVVITDHHSKDKKLPDADAVIHTSELCGAGVSYVFAQVLKKNKEFDEEGLELVALATVADCVPLLKTNRILLKEGIEQIKTTKRLGLIELLNLAGISPQNIGVYEIGHIIAPRLNSTGRIASALDSLRLLCTKDANRAKMLAQVLNDSNKERQMMTEESTQHAMSMVNEDMYTKKILVIAHESYNQGVIGLIAARMVERYYLPSLVLSIGEKFAKGSARSVKNINIIELIRSVSEHVVQAGGHPMAAGFTIEIAKIEIFRKALEEKAAALITGDSLQKTLVIDALLPFSFITQEVYKKLNYLSPFGIGNPTPVFATESVNISEIRTMGKTNTHLKLVVEQDGVMFEAVAFNGAEKYKYSTGDTIDIAYTVDFDTWHGKNKVVLKVKDIN